jgi:hypothetical protein
MIMQPQYVTKDKSVKASLQVETKKKLPAISRIRFQNLHEGLSAQIMHIGPYSAEAPTIKKLHNFIKANGYGFSGKHHEIYLSDPRKSAPEKMKMVIRQSIKKMATASFSGGILDKIKTVSIAMKAMREANKKS